MKYEFTNVGLLGSMTLCRQVNGGAWSTVRQVQYGYYDGTQQYGGTLGDLMAATVEDGYTDGLTYVFNPTSGDFGDASCDPDGRNPLRPTFSPGNIFFSVATQRTARVPPVATHRLC